MNIFLYIIIVIIWGSTWLAIKYQLGIVEPTLSIAYRFFLSSILLFLYCKALKLNLRFNWKEHFFMALQGIFIFGFNFWFLYYSEIYVVSGLVAVVFSTITLMNILNGTLFLKKVIRYNVMIGALIGISGVVLIFYQEYQKVEFSKDFFWGMILAFLGTFSASLGSIISARNQQHRLPVLQTNVYAMGYGAIMTMIAHLILNNATLTFDYSLQYISSLLYLSIFGSIIAFGAYLTLLGRIGADKAAYSTVVFPIVSLGLSSIFENFEFSIITIVGIGIILLGNVIVLTKTDVFSSSFLIKKLRW